MIDVYTAHTPNGVKVPIALEALGVPYRVHRITLGANELGQAGWIARHGERMPLAIDRYQAEANRLTAVLEARLQSTPWLAGQSYSLADVMNFGWLHAPQYAGVKLEDYPAVQAWVESIAVRPAVVRGLRTMA